MNVISMFYGVIVSMVYSADSELKVPHVYLLFQDKQAIVTIPDGILLSGELPEGKVKLMAAWIEIHKDSLIANWQLLVIGKAPFNIDPLK